MEGGGSREGGVDGGNAGGGDVDSWHGVEITVEVEIVEQDGQD